jgi:hypothetical protein
MYMDRDYTVVFMDDMAIYSDTEEDYIWQIQPIVNILHKYKFKLNDERYQFGHTETEFVGYKFNNLGIRLLDQKINSIVSWLIMSYSKDVQIF